jgi:hypothetical protein
VRELGAVHTTSVNNVPIMIDVHPSKLQQVVMRWGVVLAVGSAIYQFVTNLHTVPITGRTQVVALSQEEEMVLTCRVLTQMPLD